MSILSTDEWFKEFFHDVKKVSLEKKQAYSEAVKTYIAYDFNTGLYKIGRSKDPKNRVKALKTGNTGIIILFYCAGNIENQLHKRYSLNRRQQEWFNLSEDDIIALFEEFKPKKGFVCETSPI